MEPFERIYDADYDLVDSDSVRGSDTSDDCLEDFDLEMQRELNKRVGISDPKDEEPSEEAGSSKKSQGAQGGDPFYDPDEDDDNERWAQKQRRKQMFPDASQSKQPLSSSDAVLNCPGCMTVLCRDCQAHDTNAGQYRAMFVLNCKVDETTEVEGPLVRDRKKKRRRGPPEDPADPGNDGKSFHPVHCEFCNTRVGVFDNDEVYHFLQVLAS